MAIIWEPRFEPSQEPEETIKPLSSEEDLLDWTANSMADLGDILYSDDESDEDDEAMDVEITQELEAARPFVRSGGQGFGN